MDNDRVVFYRAPLRRQHVPLTQDKLPYVEIVAMLVLQKTSDTTELQKFFDR